MNAWSVEMNKRKRTEFINSSLFYVSIINDREDCITPIFTGIDSGSRMCV